jgi:hypothetical protein
VAVDFLVSHGEEADNHDKPVKIVRDHGAVRGRVRPTKDCIEYAPTRAVVSRVAALRTDASDLQIEMGM